MDVFMKKCEKMEILIKYPSGPLHLLFLDVNDFKCKYQYKNSSGFIHEFISKGTFQFIDKLLSMKIFHIGIVCHTHSLGCVLYKENN